MERQPHPLRGKIVVAYIRVSKGAAERDKAFRQRRDIDEWAARHGIVIAHYFVDDVGKNSRHMADKRVEFNRLFRYVESTRVDAVVLDRQDRLGFQDNAEFWGFVDRLRRHGVQLWGVTQGHLSARDPATIFTATAAAITSEGEVREYGSRALSKKIELAMAGLYYGGYPPFGCDVVCRGADGSERWRLVWVGHHQRVRIAPDGTEARYDGEDNMPGRDRDDVLRFDRSSRTERLEAVEQVFGWYATERISPTQIATRLNEAHVDPIFGPLWNKQKVKELLRNPAVIGLPTINKRASGRYWEYVGGEMREVIPERGRVKAGRRRDRADWVGPPQPIYKPIVPVELYNAVQRKLEAESAKYKQKVPQPRSPRVASFWLRNILTCSGCGLPMRAWNANAGSRSAYRSYFCATYGTYGRNNPTGCRSNRVRAGLVEGLVDRYLAEAHATIVAMLAADDADGLAILSPMEGELEAKQAELDALFRRQGRTLADHTRREVAAAAARFAAPVAKVRGRPKAVPMPGPVGTAPMPSRSEVYRRIHEEQRPALEQRLAELDAEHTALTDGVLKLWPKAVAAIAKANARILAVEAELEATRAELDNVADRIEAVHAELEARRQAIEAARESIAGDAAARRKAEAVSLVIAKAVARFKPTEGNGNQPRSLLVGLDIFPADGAAAVTCYPDGSWPGLS